MPAFMKIIIRIIKKKQEKEKRTKERKNPGGGGLKGGDSLFQIDTNPVIENQTQKPKPASHFYCSEGGKYKNKKCI